VSRETYSILVDIFWKVLAVKAWDRWDRLRGKGRYSL
jgi:hypothetical protein